LIISSYLKSVHTTHQFIEDILIDDQLHAQS